MPLPVRLHHAWAARPAAWRLALAALLLALLALDQALPPPIPATEPGSVIVAADGTPLRTYPSADGIWRHPTTPEQVSPHYLQALLGYEDRWFYWHPGVNPLAMGRAAWQWARTGHVVSGGSTLTMQVARILEPVGDVTSENAAPRSLRAKARQVLRALQLELRLSKREILTLYLNYAPMGGIVQGVEMASRSYLGHSAASLSPAEAALLAALPQAHRGCALTAIRRPPSRRATSCWRACRPCGNGCQHRWTMRAASRSRCSRCAPTGWRRWPQSGCTAGRWPNASIPASFPASRCARP